MFSSDWSIFKPIRNQDLKIGSSSVFNSDYDNRINPSVSSTYGHFLGHLNLEFCFGTVPKLQKNNFHFSPAMKMIVGSNCRSRRVLSEYEIKYPASLD